MRRADAGAVPLGGADVFHLRTDAELAREGGGRNVCLVVAEIEGRLDLKQLRARIAAGPPELRWRLGRGLADPWVWRESGPGMALVDAPCEAPLVEAAVGALDQPLSGEEPFRLLVLRGRRRDAIALAWFHAATDAKGASRLLRLLGSDEPWPVDGRRLIGERLLAALDGPARRQVMQTYLGHITSLGALPIASLASASSGPVGRPRALRLRLSAEETAAFDASLRKRAGLADTSIILWAATRLLDALLDRRGHSPPHHLVPVPLSLDPKKGSRRMFGNHLTMMMLALDRDDLRDEARAIASLGRQRRDIVRQKLDVGMIAAMQATAWLPGLLADYLARRPFGGQRASFVMSNPGDLELASFQGLAVCDAFTLPVPLHAPGFQVTADRQGGRLGVMLAFRDGLATAAEIEALAEPFRRDLLGSPRRFGPL